MPGKKPAKSPVYSIGTEKESGLHRALKFRYTGTKGKTESPLGAYVCDGINEAGEIIEVQTGSFGPLKTKIREFSSLGKIRIIHPIIMTKYIETYDEKGVFLRRRKSPRKGSEWDLFKALLYAPELARQNGLTIELALVDVLEKRRDDGKGSWRRKGISITSKELGAWHGVIELRALRDYRRFIPFAENENFTTRDLAEKAHIPRHLATKTLWALTRLGLVRRTGKRGNSIVYTASRLS
jgi:hypothetical protein